MWLLLLFAAGVRGEGSRETSNPIPTGRRVLTGVEAIGLLEDGAIKVATVGPIVEDRWDPTAGDVPPERSPFFESTLVSSIISMGVSSIVHTVPNLGADCAVEVCLG